MQTEEGSDLPFPVYLIGSALVAIAAVSPISSDSYIPSLQTARHGFCGFLHAAGRSA